MSIVFAPWRWGARRAARNAWKVIADRRIEDAMVDWVVARIEGTTR